MQKIYNKKAQDNFQEGLVEDYMIEDWSNLFVQKTVFSLLLLESVDFFS